MGPARPATLQTSIPALMLGLDALTGPLDLVLLPLPGACETAGAALVPRCQRHQHHHHHRPTPLFACRVNQKGIGSLTAQRRRRAESASNSGFTRVKSTSMNTSM